MPGCCIPRGGDSVTLKCTVKVHSHRMQCRTAPRCNAMQCNACDNASSVNVSTASYTVCCRSVPRGAVRNRNATHRIRCERTFSQTSRRLFHHSIIYRQLAASRPYTCPCLVPANYLTQFAAVCPAVTMQFHVIFNNHASQKKSQFRNYDAKKLRKWNNELHF